MFAISFKETAQCSLTNSEIAIDISQILNLNCSVWEDIYDLIPKKRGSINDRSTKIRKKL